MTKNRCKQNHDEKIDSKLHGRLTLPQGSAPVRRGSFTIQAATGSVKLILEGRISSPSNQTGDVRVT
jgi:hypothetical protein